jgi:hypothetical protein
VRGEAAYSHDPWGLVTGVTNALREASSRALSGAGRGWGTVHNQIKTKECGTMRGAVHATLTMKLEGPHSRGDGGIKMLWHFYGAKGGQKSACEPASMLRQ